MVQALETVNASFDLGLRTEKYVAGRRKSNKKLMVLTIMGRDRPGVVATISGILSENSINIEQIKMIARGEYIAMDLTIDAAANDHRNFTFKGNKSFKDGGRTLHRFPGLINTTGLIYFDLAFAIVTHAPCL